MAPRCSRVSTFFPRSTIDVKRKAIYVGTLRLHRDEFHTITKVEVRDEYAGALAEFRKRFAGEPAPRKALLKSGKR